MTIIVILWKDTFKVKHRVVDTNQAGLRLQVEDIKCNFYCYVPDLDGWIKPIRGIEDTRYVGQGFRLGKPRKEGTLKYEDMHPKDVPRDIKLYTMLLGL